MRQSFTYFNAGLGNSATLLSEVRRYRNRGMFGIPLSTRTPHLRARNIQFHLHEPRYEVWFASIKPTLDLLGIRVIAVDNAQPTPPDEQTPSTPETTTPPAETPSEETTVVDEEQVSTDGGEDNAEDGTEEQPTVPEVVDDTTTDETDVEEGEEFVDDKEPAETPELTYTALDRRSKPRNAGVYVHGELEGDLLEQVLLTITENPITVYGTTAEGANVTVLDLPDYAWDDVRAVVTNSETVILKAIEQGIPVLTQLSAEGLEPFVVRDVTTLLTAKVQSTESRQAFLDSL